MKLTKLDKEFLEFDHAAERKKKEEQQREIEILKQKAMSMSMKDPSFKNKSNNGKNNQTNKRIKFKHMTAD